METAGVLTRFREGLARTRQGLAGRMRGLLSGRTAIGEDLYEELEAVLLQADVGIETTTRLLDGLRERVRRAPVAEPAALLDLLKEQVGALLAGDGGRDRDLRLDARPAVVLAVGVNGSGKTTTLGKLAVRLAGEGKRVILAAGDTFRAAAADQLAVWAERAGADLVRHADGGDPAAVAFDAVRAATARGADALLVDTAGRLHNRANLMEELKKVRRVIARELPGAPHETLLVLDATTGLNALQQARVFTEAVAVTGVVLTKLDGTAKGGVVLAIEETLGLPVKLVGLGEGPEDLRPFDPAAFAAALFGREG